MDFEHPTFQGVLDVTYDTPPFIFSLSVENH